MGCREGLSLWLEDGLGYQCPHQARRCSTAKHPKPQPVSILQDFLIASVRSRSRILGVVLQIRRKAPY